MGWQDEVYYFLLNCGELASGNQWVANALSRVELRVVEVKADGATEPTTNVTALAALNALFHGEIGQSQMLRAFGYHLTTPGEGYLVGIPPRDGNSAENDWWRVLSYREVKQGQGYWEIVDKNGEFVKYADGTRDGEDAQAVVIRIWRPDPMTGVQPFSPVRPAIPILRELEGLTKRVAATIDSRLGGNGVLVMPKETSFTSPLTGVEQTSLDPNDPMADPFMSNFIEVTLASVQDQGSAASRVPIFLRVPADMVDKVQHITFDSPLDEQALELRDECIRRLAIALDMPPDALTGKGDLNHWNSWLSDEDGIKYHIEPLAKLICDALTTEYLWPLLMGPTWTPGMAVPEDVSRYIVEADTSALRQRPQRSAEAMTLHERLILTDAALARETGFEESDILAIGSDEFKRRLTMKTADGVTTADLTAAALAVLGVDLEPKSSEVAPEQGATPTGELPAAPASTEPPAIEAPRNPPAEADSTIAASAATFASTTAVNVAANLMVKRALERATNRLAGRGRTTRRKPVDDLEKITAALSDAWTDLPDTARSLGVDESRLLHACDGYTRQIIMRGIDHNPELLAQVIARAGLVPDPETVGG